MFHELGHAIHKLVTHTKHQHGCARDFVEIPSILLENWIWVPSVLQRLGKHYSYLSPEYLTFWKAKNEGERPDEILPERLALDIAKTKHVNGAHAMLYQVFLALFDLTIHNAEEGRAVDTTRLWNESKTEIMGLGRADSIGQASFAHPFRAYDAAYFTYAL
jgi:metallopeptidase MepB